MSFLLFLAAQAAPVAPLVEEEPITVIGKRLDTWRGRMTKARGQYLCRTTRSTGDKAIDVLGCTALTTCIGPVQPEIEAIIAAKLPKADRQRQLQTKLDAQLPCLKSTRDDLVRKLADTRNAG